MASHTSAIFACAWAGSPRRPIADCASASESLACGAQTSRIRQRREFDERSKTSNLGALPEHAAQAPNNSLDIERGQAQSRCSASNRVSERTWTMDCRRSNSPMPRALYLARRVIQAPRKGCASGSISKVARLNAESDSELIDRPPAAARSKSLRLRWPSRESDARTALGASLADARVVAQNAGLER